LGRKATLLATIAVAAAMAGLSACRYSHRHDTDSTGYADVYLSGPAAGQRITVTVGSAECSTTAG
jgi:hypothetical protein